MGMKRARKRDERGAAAVEFALVIVPFLLLVFGSIDLGWAINQDVLVNNAAREGVREGSLNPNAAAIETVVRNSLQGTPAADIHVAVTCRKASGTMCTNFSQAASGDTVIVTVDVAHDWVTPVGGTFRPGGVNLNKQAEMRIE